MTTAPPPTTAPSPAGVPPGVGTRTDALTGVRGLVVLAVVGYHLLRMVLTRHGGDWGDTSAVWWWAGTARFAVDVFFVLAGFLVIDSWRRCRARTATRSAAVRDFAARRAWRILPPYWASLVLFVPVVAPGLLTLDHAGDLLRLVTVQQYTDAELPGVVNLPIWSLTTEVHFYVAVPALALVLRGRAVPVAVVVALAASITWWSLDERPFDLAQSTIGGRIDQFVVGAAVGHLVARARGGRPSWWARRLVTPGAGRVLVAGLVLLGVVHGATFQREVDNLLTWAAHPLAGLVIGGLVARIVLGPPVRLFEARRLRWLGAISYSLYLFHYPVLDRGFDVLGLRSHAASMPAVLLGAALLVVLAVGLSATAHRLVEQPALRRRRARARASGDRARSTEPSPAEPVVAGHAAGSHVVSAR